MDADEFTSARVLLGLSPTEMASALGVSYQAVKDWQSGRRAISLQVKKQVECLLRVQTLQSEIK